MQLALVEAGAVGVELEEVQSLIVVVVNKLTSVGKQTDIVAAVVAVAVAAAEHRPLAGAVVAVVAVVVVVGNAADTVLVVVDTVAVDIAAVAAVVAAADIAAVAAGVAVVDTVKIVADQDYNTQPEVEQLVVAEYLVVRIDEERWVRRPMILWDQIQAMTCQDWPYVLQGCVFCRLFLHRYRYSNWTKLESSEGR
jgi:hypothetical protein